jgi:gluconokinase
MTAQKDEKWYLGIDLGTGSCKAVVISPDAQILGFDTGVYANVSEQALWGEQEPETLVKAMVASVRIAIKHAGVNTKRCGGLSVGGALHSMIALDEKRRPLTGIITWVDARAVDQAEAVRRTDQAQRIYRQTGCPIHTMFPIYKLMWLRENQPGLFENTAWFVAAKTYVIQRLTGQFVCDYNTAAGSGLLNTHSLKWDADSLELAGILTQQLGEAQNPRTVIEGITPELAAAMGIPDDVPLVLGASDAVNSSIGAGAVFEDRATCMVGTSGAYRIIAKKAVLDPDGRSWCYVIDPDHWLVGGAINNGGIALTWLRDALNRVKSSGSQKDSLSFTDMIRLAASVAPGADGLICLPFMAGERSPNWNMNARGVFLGLSLDHGVNHMARALLEGVAFRLCSVAEMLEGIGCHATEVRVSGGLTQSELWPQIIAAVLNVELRIPQWGETSSLGAALWALLGTGVIDTFEQINNLVPMAQSHKPNAAEARRYSELYGLYKEVYTALCPAFDRLAALNHDAS